MQEFKVTTIGPNGISDASFHIHAEGCKDIKQRKYHRSEKYNETIVSVEQLVNDSYADIIDENEGSTWEDYKGEFKIYPCVGEVPERTEVEEVEELPNFAPTSVEEVPNFQVDEEVPAFSDLVFEEELPKTVNSNYPLGKNQKVVLDYMGDNMEYFKGCGWVWYFHSSTVEVLESLETRGLVERYTHNENGSEIWVITSAGEAVYASLTEKEREVA